MHSHHFQLAKLTACSCEEPKLERAAYGYEDVCCFDIVGGIRKFVTLETPIMHHHGE